ncbi:phytanoyl-CoA dioxygenase family protein [Massilia sp. BHUDP2]|uniref:phytanoyl-CoA dioxygenase family protein n=1 Tax=Massilia sp. BHUDP2 TaxID=3034505 RepID=UPI003906039A
MAGLSAASDGGEGDAAALAALWERSAGQGREHPDAEAVPWQRQLRALYRRGISLESALHYLYGERPSRAAFQAWLLERTRAPLAEPAGAPAAIEAALSAAQLDFWDRHGYLVLPGAASSAQCEAARRAIWECLGASPEHPASWYREHPARRGMMLDFSDHPALAANRALPAVRRTCEALYGSAAIYPTIDKVSFNPPETAGWRFQGSPLHWDASLSQPVPFRLQGLLYLGDCGPQDGAFHCVPGFHRRLPEWLSTVPAGVHPRDWALSDLRPEPVPGRAGDFILWHQALPHCATPNRGILPRMVQYLTYLPESGDEHTEWI